jgi:hypothetical protein
MKRLLLSLLTPLATLSAADSGLLAEFKVGIERLDPGLSTNSSRPMRRSKSAPRASTGRKDRPGFRNTILFSDVPENVIYRWAPGNPLATVFLETQREREAPPDRGRSRTGLERTGR